MSNNKGDELIDSLTGDVTIPVQQFISLVNSASGNDAQLEEQHAKQMNKLIKEHMKMKENFIWFADVFESVINSRSEVEIKEGELIGDILNKILTPITINTPTKIIQIGFSNGVANSKDVKTIELR